MTSPLLPSSPAPRRRPGAGYALLLALALLQLLGLAAHAQLSVDLTIKRRTFMLHEPVIATVTIANNTGRDIVLADTGEGPWFSFQITGNNEMIISPRNPDYQLEPLRIGAGETAKRTVNLNELYALGDYGSYHVKASIFYPPVGKYFGSRPDQFDLTDGRKIWSQTVGVPDQPDSPQNYRAFSLLVMQIGQRKHLYVRVESEAEGLVYGCYNLGVMVEGFNADAKFDSGNNLAVLQCVGQRTYTLSRIGIDGKFMGQSTYFAPKSQPSLRKTADGTLQIVGAMRQDVAANAQVPPQDAPKLSDRPPGIPKP